MNTFFVARRMCYVFLVLIISSNIILAQDKEEHKGLYALQFQIGQNFQLSSFQGSVISGKYNFSDRDALRLGVSITTNNQDQNGLVNHHDQLDNYSSTMKNIINNFSIGLQYIRNNYYRWNINFYYGAGPIIGYNYNDNNTKDNFGNINRVMNTQWNYGISAMAGVEWYFLKDMSLSAEYGIMYNYFQETMANTQPNTDSTTKIKGFLIQPLGVRFGLSVYF